MRYLNLIGIGLFTTATVGMLGGTASGQTTWITPAGGDFHDPDNWSNNDVPSFSPVAFDLDSAYTVTFSGSADSSNVEVRDGVVTFDLQATAYTLSGFLDVTPFDDVSSTLLIKNGLLDVNGGAFISAGFGQAHVGVSNATLDVRNDLLSIGQFSAGSLLIENGGYVIAEVIDLGLDNASATGTITVRGAGSTLDGNLNIGGLGTGFVVVQDGAAAYSNFTHIGGAGSGVTIEGIGSTWDSETLELDGPSASVRVLNGAALATESTNIGLSSNSNSAVMVSGAGSTWDIAAFESYIGDSGNGSLLIEHGGSVSSNSVILGSASNATGSVIVDGVGSTWTYDAVSVGYEGHGSLHIRNGGVVAGNNSAIGDFTGSSGVVVVDGAASRWTVGPLLIGGSGDGALHVTNGGRVTAEDVELGNYEGTAALVIQGTGSRLNHANLIANNGQSSDASITIGDGGILETAGQATLAADFESTADVIVSGLGSRWTINSSMFGNGLNLAENGSASLDILNGGVVTVEGEVNIAQSGYHGTAAVTLDGTGSRLDASQTITLANGTLTVGNGSQVRVADQLYINSGTSLYLNGGQVHASDIHNSGSIRGGGTLNTYVYNDVSATIRVDNGQRLVVAGTSGIQNDGEINLLGGELEVSAEFQNHGEISGRGTLTAAVGILNAETMAFSGGFTDVFGEVNNEGAIRVMGTSVTTFYDSVIHNGTEFRISAGSHAVFLGEYSGSGSFAGTGTAHFSDDFSPGSSPASISFAGDVLFESSTHTTLELGGTTPGDEFDQVNVAGQLFLDGTLDLSLLDGFRPDDGDAFDVLTFGSLDGEFAAISGDYLGDGLFFDLVYGATSLSLLTIQAGPGDANLDGGVDIDDLVALASSYGQPGGALDWINGDFDHDGDVDLNDLANLAAHYEGGQAQALADFQRISVPEPASLSLLILSLLTCQRRRRR